MQRSAERAVLELRIVRPRADVDELAELTQSARIDPVHVHVRTLGGSGRLLCLGDDRGSGLGQVERLVDVVVEAFAEEQQRLAAPLDVAQPVRDVLDGLQRTARVEPSLRVVGVLDGFRLLECFSVVSLLGLISESGVGVGLSNVNGQLLGSCRGKLLPLKPVDGRLQEPRAARELLSGFLASARVDHRGQIVGAQVLLDEPLGRIPHRLCAREGGVQIVEQENVDAAVEGASGCAHIRFDRLGPPVLA